MRQGPDYCGLVALGLFRYHNNPFVIGETDGIINTTFPSTAAFRSALQLLKGL